MFRCDAEYYTNTEPITDYHFRAFTKKQALKKALDFEDAVNDMKLGRVQYIQVWFRGKKIFGNGNKLLFGRKRGVKF